MVIKIVASEKHVTGNYGGYLATVKISLLRTERLKTPPHTFVWWLADPALVVWQEARSV